jgi:hypothetical protein
MTELATRFLAMTIPATDGSGCLLWTGAKNRKGYGRIIVDGKVRRAHRVAWMLAYGQPSTGMHILHRCDNPSCVNAEHLYVGTNQDNVNDMMSRGRHVPPRGESNGRAKLTKSDVLHIRSSSLSSAALGKLLDVTPQAVNLVRKGINWRSV